MESATRVQIPNETVFHFAPILLRKTSIYLLFLVYLLLWVLWHINLCRLFNAKSIFIHFFSSYNVWKHVRSPGLISCHQTAFCHWTGYLSFMAYQPLQVIQCQIHFFHHTTCESTCVPRASSAATKLLFATGQGIWALWHINHCRLFNAKSIFYTNKVIFQTIQFRISTQFNCKDISFSNYSV